MEHTNPAKDRKTYYNNNKSFWHDIELYVDKTNNVFNYVVEIPYNTREKMEVCKEELHNPIVLDRIYSKPIPFTYGMMPRTFEDPNHLDPIVGMHGDNDPLDVCDITNFVKSFSDIEYPYSGKIIQIKVLGMLEIIDADKITKTPRADWKLIGIDNNVYEKYNENNLNTNILTDDIKNVIVDWYKSDPKSKIGRFFEDASIISKVVEHTNSSYEKYFI